MRREEREEASVEEEPREKIGWRSCRRGRDEELAVFSFRNLL